MQGSDRGRGRGRGQRKARGALDMLERCHRRLDERLAQLRDAAEAATAGSISWSTLADEVGQVAGFLARAGRRHELDEEESLFPRLLAADPAIAPTLATLGDQHREHANLEGELSALSARLDGSEPSEPDLNALRQLAQKLTAAYSAHIELEDQALLPAARRLAQADLDAVAEQMQKRRGR